MTLAGEGRNPSHEHFLKVAKKGELSVSKALTIIDEVKAGISKWPIVAEEAGLEAETRKQIQSIIQP